jgi:hypothetical protein
VRDVGLLCVRGKEDEVEGFSDGGFPEKPGK